MAKPIVYDFYCGLGGWSKGFLAEGYRAVGFDIERHEYGDKRYPGELVLQDVLTMHGRQFRDAAALVASPPCQKYSYMAMPWTRAKAQAAAIRADTTGRALEDLNALFNACFRIQREASEAAGRYIPLVVENVKGAQPWTGPAAWHFGPFYLWGDVPALMPRASEVKQHGSGAAWFDTGICHLSSNSPRRRQRSAEIAEIPFDLASWIARCCLNTPAAGGGIAAA
jgi:hypothetical protein